MSQVYFDKWAEMAQKAQLPMQQLVELNLKTIKEMDYIKPDEITQLNSPEKIIEKQIQLGLANGQKAINYIEKSLKIMAEAMFSAVQKTSVDR